MILWQCKRETIIAELEAVGVAQLVEYLSSTKPESDPSTG